MNGDRAAILEVAIVIGVVGGFIGWASTGSTVAVGIGAIAGIFITAMCGMLNQG